MKQEQPLLFVYGTLRRDCQSKRHEIFLSQATFLGYARTRGRLYRVEDYPGFAPDAQAGYVRGEIYELESEPLLVELDAYEGIGSDFFTPQEYRREKITCVMDNGATVSAWAYLYNRSLSVLEEISSGDWCARKNKMRSSCEVDFL